MIEILWYVLLFCFVLLAVLAMILPKSGISDLDQAEEKEATVSEEIDEITLDCWALSHNGDLGEKACSAYQQAAGYLEAASGLLKKANA